MGKIGTSRGGRSAKDRLYYPGRNQKSSPVVLARKVQRDYPEPHSEQIWSRSGASGGRTGKNEGENGGNNSSVVLPIFHNPIVLADGSTTALVVADSLLYGGAMLQFTFERDGRFGSGTTLVTATGVATAIAGAGVIVGDDPNVTWTADIDTDRLRMIIKVETETGTPDLNIVFTTIGWTRRLP